MERWVNILKSVWGGASNRSLGTQWGCTERQASKTRNGCIYPSESVVNLTAIKMGKAQEEIRQIADEAFGRKA